jgi:excinuclease UvrABC helicase subunit UvrB
MNFKKNQPLINLFESFFNNKEKFESFYNQITNKLTPTLGSTKTESGTNEDGSTWHKTTFTSADGSYTSSTYVSGIENWYSNSTIDKPTLSWDKTFNPKDYWYPTELSKLNSDLNKAVETQNFEEAVRLRDLINDYEKNSEKINDLKSKLDEAISTQNFEEAIKLRDSIKKIENK